MQEVLSFFVGFTLTLTIIVNWKRKRFPKWDSGEMDLDFYLNLVSRRKGFQKLVRKIETAQFYDDKGREQRLRSKFYNRTTVTFETYKTWKGSDHGRHRTATPNPRNPSSPGISYSGTPGVTVKGNTVGTVQRTGQDSMTYSHLSYPSDRPHPCGRDFCPVCQTYSYKQWEGTLTDTDRHGLYNHILKENPSRLTPEEVGELLEDYAHNPTLPVVKGDLPILATKFVTLHVTPQGWFFGGVRDKYGKDADATCKARGHADVVPAENCTCGFWGVPSDKLPNHQFNDLGLIAQVELSGRVIEHETGYRAQHQRIVSIMVPPCVWCGEDCDGMWFYHSGPSVGKYVQPYCSRHQIETPQGNASLISCSMEQVEKMIGVPIERLRLDRQ